MLVSIALTAACTARACTKRLDETQWPEIRDETETLKILSETRPRRDDSTSRERLETEMSRLRPHSCETAIYNFVGLIKKIERICIILGL